MQAIFVRHAQSANNVIIDGEQVITRADFERIRNHDPILSELGIKQAVDLGKGVIRAMQKPLSPYIRDQIKVGKMSSTQRRVFVAVSPTRRTLLTTLPIIDSLETQIGGLVKTVHVEVVPHLFEVGGCYSQKDGIYVGHSGLTKPEIKDIIPSAIVPDSIAKGWWKSHTRETEEESEMRVLQTVEWIRSLAFGGLYDVLLIVSHSDFSCSCMRALGSPYGLRWLYNTSLSSLTLHSETHGDRYSRQNADGAITDIHECKVGIDWINSVDHLAIEDLS